MFDPTAPLQLAAWAVAAVIALFSLGGCTSEEFSAGAAAFAAGAHGAAMGASNFNAAYQRPAPRPTLTCFNFGTIIQCN